MTRLDMKSLAAFRATHNFGTGKKLTVGLLRIATVPAVVRPRRIGTIQKDWLSPIVLSNSAK
jgi:hypothetical protein